MTDKNQKQKETEEQPEVDGGRVHDHTHYSESKGVRYCFDMNPE